MLFEVRRRVRGLKFARALLERQLIKLQRAEAQNKRGTGGLLRAFKKRPRSSMRSAAGDSAAVVPTGGSQRFGNVQGGTGVQEGSGVPPNTGHRTTQSAPTMPLPSRVAPVSPGGGQPPAGVAAADSAALKATRDASSGLSQGSAAYAMPTRPLSTAGHSSVQLSRKQHRLVARLASDGVYAQRKAASTATRRIQRNIAGMGTVRDVQLVCICLGSVP